MSIPDILKTGICRIMLVQHVNYLKNFPVNFAKCFRKSMYRTPPDDCFCMERRVKHCNTWNLRQSLSSVRFCYLYYYYYYYCYCCFYDSFYYYYYYYYHYYYQSYELSSNHIKMVLDDASNFLISSSELLPRQYGVLSSA